MNKRVWLTSFVFLLHASVGTLFAQQDKVWVFGTHAGIDFNTSPPQAIQTSINASEACASVSDVSGNLLFYTNGSTVWNRNHAIMPNGENLPLAPPGIVESSSQGTLIASVPGDPDKYYIFSLGSVEYSYFGRLYYSIVDMSLDNGNGDVLAGQKGMLLDSLLTEHMTAVAGDDCNIWLVVQSRSEDKIKSYRIDHSGIHPSPILSDRIPGDGGLAGGIGCMDVSPDGRKIAVAQGNLVLYDFDPATGVLDNSFIVDDFQVGISPGGYYGVAFSPDNSKLYANDVPYFYQFDLSLNTTTDIRQSKIRLSDTSLRNATIKRGPDGKMYASTRSVIHHPNLPGMACQFVARGFTLLPGTGARWGLPNINAVFHYEQRSTLTADTFTCVDSVVLFPQLTHLSGYLWNDGSTGPSKAITESGLYWVKYYDLSSGCIRYTDSFDLSIKSNTRNFTTDTLEGMCAADTLLLQSTSLAGTAYQWDNGATAPERRVHQAGTYWVQYRVDSLCAQNTDSFIVNYPAEPYKVSFSTDSFICVNSPFLLTNTSPDYFKAFYWMMGDGHILQEHAPVYQYADTGTFFIQLVGKINERCYDTVSKPVIIDPRGPAFFSLGKDEACIGETVLANVEKDVTLAGLRWNWGDGVMRDVSSDGFSYQHAYDRTGIFPVQLTATFRACPDTSYADTIQVFAFPEVELGGDGSICLHGAPVYLKNLREAPLDPYHQVWSTGDTTATLKVVHPGIYTLSVTAGPIGCTTTESIEISKDCYVDIPNAFTPNGDGHNDYFLPRVQLSQSLSRFHMQVFNRWGQVVFETNRINARGWDGRFNDKVQPTGVYLYRIEADFTNGRQEQYEGNVTLLR